MNLTQMLDRPAMDWPQKPALIEGDTLVSYAQLVEKVTAWATQLQSLRLPPGCRVGLCYPNSVTYVALTFALWRLNLVVVPIALEGAEQELSELARTLQLEAILSSKPLGKCSSVALAPDCFVLRLTPDLPPDNHGLNIAFIRFTSGTTHARKGVVLTHETICERVQSANQALGIGPEDTVMWCLPMAHHFLITIVLYLSQGATIVLARQVLARPFLETTERWGGTVLYAAPFHYALLARDPSGAKLSSVRLAISTTCTLPGAVVEDFFKRFQRPLVQALGIIELGLVTLNTADPRQRWNSVGRPVGQFQVRILAADAEGCGQVAVAGPGMFDAYAWPWLPRAAVTHDGWFMTGDIGRLDAEGFLFLMGRDTAVINLAGRKVFPEEIEAVLNCHPAVRESRAYGRAHPVLGEIVEADVVLADEGTDLDSIRELCRSRLASFKIPSCLHIVRALPRTAVTGKIRRPPALASHV